MKQFVFDIEANGLNPDKVWCICMRELGTNNKYTINSKGRCDRTFQSVFRGAG